MQEIEFKDVTVHAKANVYFDGKVVSHSIIHLDGSKKTMGLIYPGSYHFNTEQAEKMEIIAPNLDDTIIPFGRDTIKTDSGPGGAQ